MFLFKKDDLKRSTSDWYIDKWKNEFDDDDDNEGNVLADEDIQVH